MDLEKFFQWLSAILAAIWSFPVSTKKFIEINILEGIVDLIRDSFSMIPSRWAELVAKLLSDIVGFLKSLALYLHRGLIKGKAFSHLVELILPSTVSTAHMSYDDVLNGRTRPPAALPDLMLHLMNVVHAAEGLQFSVWALAYKKRVHSSKHNMRSWSPDNQLEAERRARVVRTAASPIDRSLAAPWEDQEGHARFSALSPEVKEEAARTVQELYDQYNLTSPFTNEHSSSHTTEMQVILATYISPRGSRCVKFSYKRKFALLLALQTTFHPDVFAALKAEADRDLRGAPFESFRQTVVRNANRDRIRFAKALGIMLLYLGILTNVFLLLSNAPRPYRALPSILYILGTSCLICACKGICVLLHNRKRRQLRPWEIFLTEEQYNDQHDPRCYPYGLTVNPKVHNQPWIVEYKKRYFLRRIFDREVCIEDPAILRFHTRLFYSSLVIGVLIAAAISVIWVFAIPSLPRNLLQPRSMDMTA